MSDEADHLICPHDQTALKSVAGDTDEIVRCLKCGYECFNYIKYPVVEVMDGRGELWYRNVLTGAYEDQPEG